MYCNYCGRQIDDDAVYCNYCGRRVDKIEDKVEEKIEDKVEEKIEDKVEEKIEDKVDIIRYISKISITLCILLLMIGSIVSIINTFKFFMSGRDTSYIFGQVIFGSIFIMSTVLLIRSKKIGAFILIPFILFKMTSSIYYYFNTISEYFTKNLIIDEIFYIILISLLVLGWKNLK